jgi:hypothetical protein
MEVSLMLNYTRNSYEMKRNITKFISPLIAPLPLDEKRFVADMFKGILSEQSLVVSDIARGLSNETTQKANFKRLSRQLKTFSEYDMMAAYFKTMKPLLGDEPLFLFDDSDITKPHGNVFEGLGIVRDGSDKNGKLGKGYCVAQVVGLTAKTMQPFPVAHQIYSPSEKDYSSNNEYTNQHVKLIASAFGPKSTLVFDRGYDDKKLMEHVAEQDAHFIIRARSQRKYVAGGVKYTMQEMMDNHKGKYTHQIKFQGDYFDREVKLSVVPVSLLASELTGLHLVLVYGVSKNPMLLLTNKKVDTKEQAVTIFNSYFLRWRIEEFFRTIKQVYGFENMRVQSLKRMNTLSWMLQFVMGYQAYFIETQHKNRLWESVISSAKAYKKRVSIWFYQTAEGIQKILQRSHQNLHEMLGLNRPKLNRQQLSLF